MNVEINDNNRNFLKEMCKETKMNPSQLKDFLLDFAFFLHSDYERQKNEGAEKRSFLDILANLCLYSYKSKYLSLEVSKNLIESTNQLLGIKDHNWAAIYNIYPDFEKRSISYAVCYDFCVDATNIYAYKSLEIGVEINQDYIEVSHVVYLPTFERMEIPDKKLNNTSNLVQEYIRDKDRKEFSPFANIAVELLSTGEKPFVLGLENHFGFSQEVHQYIRTRVIVKTARATHIPSIERLSLIAREVHAIVIEELAAK